MGIDDSIKTKVLGHLMQGMVALHGAHVPKVHKEGNSVLPNPDGSTKHEPAGKIEGEGVLPGKSHHFNLEHTTVGSAPPDMNDGINNSEGGEEGHDLGDLFGRKKPDHAEYF